MTQDTDDDHIGVKDKDEVSWLHQYRMARPGSLSSVLEAVIDEVTWIEARERKRKTKDAQSFRLVVDVLVSNLAYSLLKHPEGRPMVISRRLRDRKPYDNPAIPRNTFVQTVGLLEAAGFLTQALGAKGKGATTILPTSRLGRVIA